MSLADAKLGLLSPTAGYGSYRFVIQVYQLTGEGKVQGIITASPNKPVTNAHGHKWPGHMELLAHEFWVKNFNLVLSTSDLYFLHPTTRVSLQLPIKDVTP
ncbi:4-hydroxythreonine-4-phosphate dehydrogenase PdxA [Arthrobacter sp. RIT-PI-e]|uniref:4-hydroxythreonine-4-phosphate dehydrogenase PdxA n=1 Tax=Arthrobacter sp. RIT-PI-e TaxID=1681197 RepID=UPI0009E5317D